MNKDNNIQFLLSSAGALGGLYYAFTKNKGGWGYVGFFILGGIAGSLAGGIINTVINPSSTPNRINQPTDSGTKITTSTSGTEEDKQPTVIKGEPLRFN
jgi:hypothetical protein